MRIEVLYFAALKRATGGIGSEEVTLPEGSCVEDALSSAVARHPGLEPWIPSLLVSRNREWSARDEALADGDEVGLMPPVSGG